MNDRQLLADELAGLLAVEREDGEIADRANAGEYADALANIAYALTGANAERVQRAAADAERLAEYWAADLIAAFEAGMYWSGLRSVRRCGALGRAAAYLVEDADAEDDAEPAEVSEIADAMRALPVEQQARVHAELERHAERSDNG